MKRFTPVLFAVCATLALVGCISVTRPVTFAEMGRPPFLQQDERGELILNLSNSRRHSALSIVSISTDIRRAEKIVLIQGRQSPAPITRPVFRLTVPREEIMEFQYYWQDPDGQRHRLAFE